MGFDRSVSAIGISTEGGTPSRAVGTAVMLAILIFFAIKAAELLQSPIIAAMLAQVLELGSKVLFGAVIILGGVAIARIVSSLVSGAGTEGWLPTILRWSIIALAVAMGLQVHGPGQRDRDHRLRLDHRLGGGRLRPRLRAGRAADRAQAARAVDRCQCGARRPAPVRRRPRRSDSRRRTTAALMSRHPAKAGASGRPAVPFDLRSRLRRDDDRFARFAAIDWSGAKGRRHKGIAVAVAEAGTARPRLVRPDHVWSRTEVLEWLLAEAAAAPTLFGFDFSFAPPIAERGEYLPGEPDVPSTAREFWAYVERRSDDEDLGAASFLEQAHRRHFYFGIADGEKARFMHFRQCDARLNAQGGRKTASAYDAIGAAQVAKASFSGMRLLHRLGGRVAVWPMDALPEQGSAVVEIYTRIYLRRAGLSGNQAQVAGRARSRAGRRSAAARRGFASSPNDHQTDALVTAAGMRALAAAEPRAFAPEGLTPELARTEGWTFGIL